MLRCPAITVATGDVAGTKSPACDGSTESADQVPCCKAAAYAVDASHGTVRHIRGSARMEADHDGQGGRRGAGGTPRLPGRPAWREPGRGATCRAGRGAVPVVSGRRTARGAAGAEWLAGQMSRDTPRLPHATAREYASTGQYRTTVRGPDTLTGTGSPSKTQHHRSRPLSRPRSATSPSRSEPAERTAAHVRHGSI